MALYQHDVSEFDAGIPSRHGLFGVDDSVTTLATHAELQNAWWSEPEALFPYLILADGRPAGFNLIAARARLPKGIDADFVVHEFFALHAYRGKGVAERAATLGEERSLSVSTTPRGHLTPPCRKTDNSPAVERQNLSLTCVGGILQRLARISNPHERGRMPRVLVTLLERLQELSAP